ncbi:inactive ribonuclease-like protein 10 [Dromiciops gliroides]|uniref:inactive ribonuclease-like protein 10 n=1 Tax=Dromiciops gliroides TaxID=33562 RepID=UPI001CC614CD|nr:inactive ribonuclease-like protein 10 [Dromiciops gliroides]
MKTVLPFFPVVLLFLGLGWGHRLAPAVLDDSQELLNQLWASDSWEEAAEDMDLTKTPEAQEAGDNDMLLLDSMESSLAEAFLREDEVKGEEESEAEEPFHQEGVLHLRQVQFVMKAQKTCQPKSICRVQHTFIHENLDEVKAMCVSPRIPCKENKCHQSSELWKFAVCQLIGDIVFPNKCYYQSTPVTVTVTIDCNGMEPQSLNY